MSKDKKTFQQIMNYFDDEEEEEEENEEDNNFTKKQRCNSDFSPEEEKEIKEEENENEKENENEDNTIEEVNISNNEEEEKSNNEENLYSERNSNEDDNNYIYDNNNIEEYLSEKQDTPKLANKESENEDEIDNLNLYNETEYKPLPPPKKYSPKKENFNFDNTKESNSSLNRNCFDEDEKEQEEFLMIQEERRKKIKEQKEKEKLKEDINNRKDLQNEILMKKKEEILKELNKKKEKEKEKNCLQSTDILSSYNSDNKGKNNEKKISEELNCDKINEDKDLEDNNIFETITTSQKNIYNNENDEEEIKNNILYNDENFDDLVNNNYNNNINKENFKNLFQEALYNDEEKFSFQPKIDQNSKKIIEKKSKQYLLNNNSNKENKIFYSERDRINNPFDYNLYNDALKRREKLNKIEFNKNINIELDINRSKINNKSQEIYINKIEKIIDNTIEKYDNINYFNLSKIFYDLKIFRELTSNKKNEKEIKNINDFKYQLNNIKSYENRKIEEYNFLIQFWIKLNPNNNENLNKEILSGLLKILFEPEEVSLEEMTTIVNEFMETALFLNNDININNQTVSKNSFKNENENGIFCAICEKNIKNEEIWTLPVFIKKFKELKKNLIAYKKIGKLSNETQKEMNKIKDNFTFKPKINNNIKSTKENWEKKLSNYYEKEKKRREALEEEKQMRIQNDLNECTFQPNISNFAKQLKNKEDKNIYERLYQDNKIKLNKLNAKVQQSLEDIYNKEKKICTFKPKINKNDFDNSLNKSYTSIENQKSYDLFVQRQRNGILENFKKKYLLEKKFTGENYEKFKNNNIKPPNITYIRKVNKKKEKDLLKRTCNVEYIDSSSGEESDGNNKYFTMDFKLPNRKKVCWRIYINDEPEEIANKFCRIYNIKNDIEIKLAEKIKYFKDNIFNENINSNNEN